jgi:hypothetical protein
MIRFVSVIRCHIRVFKYDLKGPLYQILGHVSKCPNARGMLVLLTLKKKKIHGHRGPGFF